MRIKSLSSQSNSADMKKILLAVSVSIMVILIPGRAYGFSWGKIGVKGAYNTAVITSSDVGSIGGGGGGVALNLKLPVPGMSVQPELDFVYKYDRTMMEIPVNFQVGLDLVLVRPFICLTPYMDIPLSSSGDVSMFQAGFGVGGGIDIWRFQVQCRYNWNITDFSKSVSGKLRGLDLSLIFFF